MYKCKEHIDGFAIRMHCWSDIEAQSPELMNDLKLKLLSDYEKNIRNPMIDFKNKDIILEQ